MSLATKAGQAGALMLFRKGWGALVSFGVMAYLARVLDKSDFGLLAISATLIGIIETVALSGIGEYVIFYRGKDEREVANSAFWLNLLLTVVVCASVLVAAPLWASFYKDERINRIIWLLLVGFFFNMLASISVAQFRKTLDYKPLVLIQTIFGTIAQLSQIVFALLGFGVYSLALPHAVITPVMAITLIYRSGFRPEMKMHREHWGRIFSYTKHVIGGRVLGKFVNEGDTLIVGKFLGMELLGVYNLAFRFAHLFFANFLPIITNVTMPVFSQIRDNLPRLRDNFTRSLKLIAFVSIPVISFQILFAEPLINLIYGPKWHDAVMPFQILSLFVLFKSVGSPTSGLYNATGKPQIGFYFSLIFAPVFLGSVMFSSTFNSLIITTLIVASVRILGTMTHFFLSGRILKVPGFSLVAQALKSLVPAIIIAIPIYLFRLTTGCHFTIVEAIIFITGYFLLYYVLLRTDWREILLDLEKMMPKKLKNIIPSRLRIILIDEALPEEIS